MKRIYNAINEDLAKRSRAMWSFSDYKEGSATREYEQQCNKVYEIAEKVIEKKPQYSEKVEMLTYRYIEKLANWYNKKFSIDLMYPSQMICGAGNFNMNKHNRQQKALENHFSLLHEIESIAKKIEHIETQKEIIKSGDSDAIEKLNEKLKELELLQEKMKEANKYFKKNGTLKGCKYFGDRTEEQIQKLDESINDSWDKKPFASYQLTNNNAKIKNTKQRIEEIRKIKEQTNNHNQESEKLESELFEIVENGEQMRLQLIFMDKPNEDVRALLKSNGYRWSPKNSVWQRQLTENARYNIKRIKPKLEELLA